MMKRTSILLLILQAFIFNLNAQSYFPERKNWEAVAAENSPLSQEVLDSLERFAIANEYSGSIDLKQAILKGFEKEPFHDILGPTKDRGRPAGMILYKGKILKQWGDLERVDMTFSVTKSYLSTIAGLAFDQQMIELDSPVVNWVWDGTFAGKHNAKVTWSHLLDQSSDWSGELFGIKDWADRVPEEGGLDDWRFRELNEPGTVYEYNDVRVNVLAYSLLQLWREPLPKILKQKIMDPIGASTTWRWYGYDQSFVTVDGISVQSVSGGGHSGGGIFISTLDHARFGLLFMNNGIWNGKRLLSSEWIKRATTSSKSNPNYGYMWWLNSKDGKRHYEGVPEHVFYGAGFGGNYIVVDQENEFVIVLRWLEPKTLRDFLAYFYSNIDEY